VTLVARLSLGVVAFGALVALVFGGLLEFTYQRQLDRQLVEALEQDLRRVAALLDQPDLGASFVGAADGTVVLQFLTSDGRVVLGWGDQAPLPSVDRPTRLNRDGRWLLVAQAPWGTVRGSIRLAHDVTDALATVGDLRRSILLSGAVVVVLAALVALIGVRRMLHPLADLARQTRRVDPATPGTVTYRGPRDEVQELASGLNDALGAIRERQERERAFLHEVAHELAAPLTLVHYHLDELRRREPHEASLRAASDAARELLRTSQDLLVVARGELERVLEPVVLDLRDVVSRVADEYPGVQVEVAGAAEVVGDPARLMQVVRNLVRNAVQASGGTAGVRVRVRDGGDGHVVEVHDAGPGMSDDVRARAFDHGFSGGRGSGVGLAVVRALVERHGGRVEVASSTSAGTVMAVWLPSLASRLGEPEQRGGV
jgi:two-component system, OmpR family, sensor kinase